MPAYSPFSQKYFFLKKAQHMEHMDTMLLLLQNSQLFSVKIESGISPHEWMEAPAWLMRDLWYQTHL